MERRIYLRNKKRLLLDQTICKENRDLWFKFFDYQERKLKRQNGFSELDNSCYKTLNGYIYRFKNVNKWFNNKPWINLTKADIKKVYDDLEDGVILTLKGKPFKDKKSYYSKVFKSKPFSLAGKADLSKEVIEFSVKVKEEVRFIYEDDFKKLVDVISNPLHKCLILLAWDIGENINSLLQLQKKDFTEQINSDTQEKEYKVNLPKHKLKRSRRERSLLTLHPITTKYLDLVLSGLDYEEIVFNMGYRNAYKFLKRAANKTKTCCYPGGQLLTWKDLRSSMACYLLSSGWTREEVNSRLGHVPSSSEIDKYINFLALDEHKPKKKTFNYNIERLQNQLEKNNKNSKLVIQRQQEEINFLKEEVAKLVIAQKAIKEKI